MDNEDKEAQDAEQSQTTAPNKEQSSLASDNEENDSSLEGGVDLDKAPDSSATPPPPANKPSRSGLYKVRRRINVYILLLILIIVVSLIVVAVAYLQAKHATNPTNIKTQKLTQSTLNQLANGDVTVGTNQSILNVQSSAVFAGQVLVKQGLQVAGNIQIGGTTALNNLSVNGTSQFGQVTVNKALSVASDAAIQGTLTVANSLQVNGSGTFSGDLSAPQVTTSNLQLNSNLVLTHHISVNGSTPSRSGGPALGDGGSVSLNGTDIAGSITINTGGSTVAGCFVTVNFASAYSQTPHVVVTPIGSAAGGLSYYVNRSSTSFSVCVDTAAPAASSFGFDYFVVD